ncbi:SUR7/PalI family-domain-containing protein [Hypoxylon argillaceum]|nr:SUR7/PalI family-domain-containing protein [Hypoxylon argillaceum]KAI1154409.1 SUR7/PalI family-domain-containing protein [Nemania diffusa]
MARSRAAFAPLALLLLAGSIVLLLFVILAGTVRTTPFRQTHFLSADTSGIAGARALSRWTYFRICGADNTGCSHAWPDPPVGWAWSRNPTGSNLPTKLIGSYGGGTTSFAYFYMWRFGWVFYLLALLFTVVAFFTGFLACFGRLGSALAALMSSGALFFLALAASLMTATFVKMRAAFTAVGRDASLGVWAFGFTWGAVAAVLIATVLFWLGIRGDGAGAAAGGSGGARWGRRRRSVRSRRSYDMGTHRVKEDYA